MKRRQSVRPHSRVCSVTATPSICPSADTCSIRCAQLQRRPRLLPFFFPLTRSSCDPAEVSASLFLRHTHPPPALLSFLVPPTPLTCCSIVQLPPLLPGPCCPPVRAKQFRRQDGAHRRGAACRRSRRAKRCSCAKCHSRRGCVSSRLRLFSMALQLQGRDTIKCIYSHSWALIRAQA